MREPTEVEIQIGEAWGYHREGRNSEAAASFERVVASNPENVDAHYGLGLAQRANGQEEQAIKTLQKAFDLSKKRLEAVREEIGDDLYTRLTTGEDDRYMMLTRMIGQRLAELGVKPE